MSHGYKSSLVLSLVLLFIWFGKRECCSYFSKIVRMLNFNVCLTYFLENFPTFTLASLQSLRTITVCDDMDFDWHLEFLKCMVICIPACRMCVARFKMLCGVVNFGCSQASWPIKCLARRWTFGIIIWFGNCYFTSFVIVVSKFLEDNEWFKFGVVITCCHYIIFMIYFDIFIESLSNVRQPRVWKARNYMKIRNVLHRVTIYASWHDSLTRIGVCYCLWNCGTI